MDTFDFHKMNTNLIHRYNKFSITVFGFLLLGLFIAGSILFFRYKKAEGERKTLAKAEKQQASPPKANPIPPQQTNPLNFQTRPIQGFPNQNTPPFNQPPPYPQQGIYFS